MIKLSLIDGLDLNPHNRYHSYAPPLSTEKRHGRHPTYLRF